MRPLALIVLIASLVMLARTCAPLEPQRMTVAQYLAAGPRPSGDEALYVELSEAAFDLREAHVVGSGLRQRVAARPRGRRRTRPARRGGASETRPR